MTKKALRCLCFLVALSIILVCCGTQRVTSDPIPATEGLTTPMVTATTQIPATKGLTTPMVTATTQIPAANVENMIFKSGRFRVPPVAEIDCKVDYIGRLPVFLTLADDQRDVIVSELERSEVIEIPVGDVVRVLRNPVYRLELHAGNEMPYFVTVWLTSTDQILLGISSLGDGYFSIQSSVLKTLLTSFGQNVDLPDDIAEKITKIELIDIQEKIEVALSSDIEAVLRRTIRDGERREGVTVCCVYIEMRLYTDTGVYYGCVNDGSVGVEGIVFALNKKDRSTIYSAFSDDTFDP